MQEEQIFLSCFMAFWFIVLSIFEWDERRMKRSLKIGDRIIYLPTGDKGIVKSVKGDSVYVVYHCDENWREYNNYTAELTSISSIKKGWDL